MENFKENIVPSVENPPQLKKEGKEKRREIANMLRKLEIISKSDGALPDYGFKNVSPKAKEKLLEEIGVYKLSNGYKIEISATDNSEDAHLMDEKGNSILSESIQIGLSSNYSEKESKSLKKELKEKNPNKLSQLYFNEYEKLQWITYKKGDMMLIERVGRMMREKFARKEYENLLDKNKNQVNKEEYKKVLIDLLKNTTNIEKAVKIINQNRTGEHDLNPRGLDHLDEEIKDAFSESIEDNLSWVDLQDKKNAETKKQMEEIFSKVVSKDYSQILTDRVAHRLLVLMRPYLKFE